MGDGCVSLIKLCGCIYICTSLLPLTITIFLWQRHWQMTQFKETQFSVINAIKERLVLFYLPPRSAVETAFLAITRGTLMNLVLIRRKVRHGRPQATCHKRPLRHCALNIQGADELMRSDFVCRPLWIVKEVHISSKSIRNFIKIFFCVGHFILWINWPCC